MEQPGHVPLLVIGAGPYALSAAAHAKRHGVDPLVVGEPMAFWRQNMPEGMLLRSGTDWHLDADEIDTFEAYLGERGIDPADVRSGSPGHLRRLRRLVLQADGPRTAAGVRLLARAQPMGGSSPASTTAGG